jgi:glycosyltransferase involved in cell wall biosynthesis
VGSRIKLLVDGVFFSIANSGIARLWQSVLPLLHENEDLDICLLDRGNAPNLPGIMRIPFPRLTQAYTAQDSFLLEDICRWQRAHVFVSTYYTTPLRTPSLATIYDMIPERQGWNLNDRIWSEKEVFIAHARRHLCISQRSRLDLLEFYPELLPENTEFAYCGVDPTIFFCAAPEQQEAFRRSLDLHRPFYLLVGERCSFDGYKNARSLFEAANQISPLDFDIVCVGGAANLEPSLLQLAPANCRVLRIELDDRDLAAAYGAATALIYPSLYEGFGLPVVEAMACGCPVITTRAGALPEAAGTAALFIDGRSVPELVDAMRSVRDPKIRARLIEDGIKHSSQFRWPSFAQAVARNVRIIAEVSTAGKYDELYARWTELRAIQRDVDIAHKAPLTG